MIRALSIGGIGCGALLAGAALAASPSPQGADPAKLRGVCNDVFVKTKDRSNLDLYLFAFEKKIYDAAGIDFTRDNVQVARAKVNYLWDNFQPAFRCDVDNFSVPNGNILKYAEESKTFDLLDDALVKWHLDLNKIDAADGLTILDFLALKLSQSKGTPLEPLLQLYFERARKGGAKFAAEVNADRAVGRDPASNRH